MYRKNMYFYNSNNSTIIDRVVMPKIPTVALNVDETHLLKIFCVLLLWFNEFLVYFDLLNHLDERKLDRVLQETERNRQMASQILTTTFHSQTSGQEILPRGPEVIM